MPKPLADRREVDARLEQVNRRGMAKRVGVDPLLLQGARRGGTGHDILVEQIADAKRVSLLPRRFVNSNASVVAPPLDVCCANSRSRVAVEAQIGQSRTLPPLPRSRTW